MRKHDKREPSSGISLLVPFRSDGKGRTRVWSWLKRYYEFELPGVEIVVGRDRSHRRPFSKTAAVNDAARRAHGDIFVILDADAYVKGITIKNCAEKIIASLEDGYPLWFVPYRRIYRLTRVASRRVLHSDPTHPLRFPSPPDATDVESTEGSAHGHHFGAMIQIMPREAFELVGGMDERFRGWGGEDVAFLRALDTLYGKHKTVHTNVLHLWHPIHNEHKVQSWTVREWVGQKKSRMNDRLAARYDKATGDKVAMRLLVEEGIAWSKARKFRRETLWLTLISSLIVLWLILVVWVWK